MPAVVITDGPPPCACVRRAVVLSCFHLAGRWLALECRSAWLVEDTRVKVCSRETHSPSWASKIYGHNAYLLRCMEFRRGLAMRRNYTKYSASAQDLEPFFPFLSRPSSTFPSSSPFFFSTCSVVVHCLDDPEESIFKLA